LLDPHISVRRPSITTSHGPVASSMTVSNALVEPEGKSTRMRSATSVSGLYLAGDWVDEGGILSDAAFASARAAAKAILAAARGIEIEEVESSFEGDIDLHGFLDLDENVRKGYQGIRVNFKIKADVPEEQLQEIVELGTGHSPVFDSLTKGVPVSVNAKRL